MPSQLWINGAYRAGSSGKIIEVQNPATEEIIDTAPAANAADVNLAITAAQAAFPAWKKIPAAEKAEMLHEIAQKLSARSDEFARLLTLEGGKPLVENKVDISPWVNPGDSHSHE
ncbi:MAG: aldehyde dehydrogenase family protein [Ktedonobacteraceae bacterium]